MEQGTLSHQAKVMQKCILQGLSQGYQQLQALYFAVIMYKLYFSFPVKCFFAFCDQELLFAIVGAYQGQSLIHVTFAVKR